jgi:hypothetical protein
MPPPGSGLPPLTEDEKMTIARWIDLGAPINWGGRGTTPWGWFLDEIRPTLEVSSPRPGANVAPLERVRVAVADANSGVAPGSLSLVADVPLAGRAAGQELADLLVPLGDGIHELPLLEPLAELDEGHLLVQVADRQGNWTRIDRRFSVGDAPPPEPGPGICDPAPRACAGGQRSVVRMNAASRKLLWTWQDDEPAASGAFGDPVRAATGFALCAYDADGLVLSESVLAGGSCGGRPCWTALAAGGYRYRGAATSSGLTRLVLKPASAGKARIRVEGRGAALDLPVLPIGTMPVTVQLVRRDDPARCWQAEYTTARANDATVYRAMTP